MIDSQCGYRSSLEKIWQPTISYVHPSLRQIMPLTTISDYQIPPITRLPNEMLESIFDIHVVSVYYREAEGEAKLLFAYSQVCRWWRDIALSSPRLWRHINIGQPRLAREFLARSRLSVPLSVGSWWMVELPMDLVPLQPYVERIQEVDLNLLPKFDIHRALASIEPDYQQLSALRVTIRRSRSISPPADLELDCYLPSVRRLSLEGVSVRWAFLTNLTHLSLRTLTRGPSTSELYFILQSSLQLESLCIAHITFREVTLPPPQVIQLPRLLEITLFQKPTFTSSLLSALSISTSAQLRVSSFSPEDGFLSVFPQINDLYYPHLRITKDSILSIYLSEIHLRQCSAPPFSDSNSKPDLIIHMPRPVPAYAWTLSDLPKLFDLYKLTTLELDIIWVPNVDDLVAALNTLFAAAPNLMTLRAAQHGAECLSMVLGKPGEDRLEFDVLCPRLTRLSFGTPDQMWWDFPLRWLKPIVTCLEERAFYTGVPLKTIEFIGQGRIDMESAQVFAPFVEEIVNSVFKRS